MRICCLPVGGKEDNYQTMMMNGLRRGGGFDVMFGATGKIFTLLATWLRHRPTYIHLDWNTRYFLRRNFTLTVINVPLFLLELLIVRYVLRCRIVWTMHNIHSHGTDYRRVERFCQQAFARVCDWVRVFSKSSVPKACDYLKVDAAKIVPLPEPSFLGHYPDEICIEAARTRLGLARDAFVLLCFGSIRAYKDIVGLVSVFKRRAAENWQLLVAGRPHDADYVKQVGAAVRGDARIHAAMEMIPEDQVQYFFNACDLVVLPYKAIENSGPMIMAMGFSKPIVAPALGVIPERLARQRHLLYEPGCLPEALERAAGMSRDELATIGRRNYQEVTKHKWEDFAELFRE